MSEGISIGEEYTETSLGKKSLRLFLIVIQGYIFKNKVYLMES